MKMNRIRKTSLIFILIALFALAGCSSGAQSGEEATQSTPVEIRVLSKGSIQTEVVYAGQVRPAKQISAASKVSGKVKTVYADVGDIVAKDDVLCALDEKDIENNVNVLKAQLKSADAAVATARAGLDNVDGSLMQTQISAAYTAMQAAELMLSDAQTAYNNTKALYEADAVSLTQLTQAESGLKQAQLGYEQAAETHRLLSGGTVAENRRMAESALAQAQAARDAAEIMLANAMDMLSDTAVRAPMAGVVTERSAEEGAMLSPATPPFTIMELSTVYVNVNVSEQSLASLSEGQTADVHIGSLGTKPFEGKISLVSPAADEMTNTYLVKIELENPDGKCRPGMFAEVHFINEKSEDALVLPRGAVLGIEEDSHVFVEENGVCKKMPVRTGIDNGKEIEILSGLSEGARVITTGQSFLTDSAPVTVVNADKGVK